LDDFKWVHSFTNLKGIHGVQCCFLRRHTLSMFVESRRLSNLKSVRGIFHSRTPPVDVPTHLDDPSRHVFDAAGSSPPSRGACDFHRDPCAQPRHQEPPFNMPPSLLHRLPASYSGFLVSQSPQCRSFRAIADPEALRKQVVEVIGNDARLISRQPAWQTIRVA
jgi:hypothetical protein